MMNRIYEEARQLPIFGQMLGLDYETKIKELTKELSKGRKNDRD